MFLRLICFSGFYFTRNLSAKTWEKVVKVSFLDIENQTFYITLAQTEIDI